MVILQFRPLKGKVRKAFGRSVLEALANLDRIIHPPGQTMLNIPWLHIDKATLSKQGATLSLAGKGCVTRLKDIKDIKRGKVLAPLNVLDDLEPWPRQVILDKVFVELFGNPDGKTFDLDKEVGGDELDAIVSTVITAIEDLPCILAYKKKRDE